jgi:hypothetical protein
VEAVGAAGDQAELVVERFGAALVDPEADCGADPVTVFAHRLPKPDERFEAVVRDFGEESVGQHGDIVDGEAGSEDRPEGFFESVGAPDLTTGAFEPAECGGLLVSEVRGCFEQRPASVLEPAGGGLVADAAQLVTSSSARLPRATTW